MNETNKVDEGLERELSGVVRDLSALADEVKLKVHLGSMDAKDAWERLEPRVSQLKERVTTTKGQLLSELNASAKDLKAELHDLGALLGIDKG